MQNQPSGSNSTNQGNGESGNNNSNGNYYGSSNYYGSTYYNCAPFQGMVSQAQLLDLPMQGMWQAQPFWDMSMQGMSQMPFGGASFMPGMSQATFGEGSLQGMSQAMFGDGSLQGMSQAPFADVPSIMCKERHHYHPYKRNKPTRDSAKLHSPNKRVPDTRSRALEYVNRAMAPRIPTDGPSSAPQSSSRKSRKSAGAPENLQPYTPAQDIPKPESYATPKSTLINSTNSKRSTANRINMTLERARRRIYQCLKYADRYRLPFSHNQLQALNKPNFKAKYENVCTRLLNSDHPSRPFSAQYFDIDGKPLFFYFGHRWTDDKEKDKPMVDLGNNYQVQYQNRTLADLKEGLEANREVTCDGIEGTLLENFHGSTQELCSVLKPTRGGPELRHDWTPNDPNPRVMQYKVKGSQEVQEERKFVAHLVHCWPQQAQPEKGLYPCSLMTKSGKGLGQIRTYYNDTRMVAEILGLMFEACFPDYYKEYKEAFEAGQWVEQDPGPWLGRAIVYKLQSSLHLDAKDFGPTACIPFGFFTGGEMAVPQFEAKLSYVSCFSLQLSFC
ncbi:hypothetical protein APHAL10511_008572 [Amanita phalloides]|nr:hypothetical protein APHAL10511_008572 [Amanita phalloides]